MWLIVGECITGSERVCGWYVVVECVAYSGGVHYREWWLRVGKRMAGVGDCRWEWGVCGW